jgi:hypothetical protein
MQGICTYIPETNNVPRDYTVAAILLLLFMVPIPLVSALALLCFYVSTSRSMCAVPNMAVFCSLLLLLFCFVAVIRLCQSMDNPSLALTHLFRVTDVLLQTNE